MSKSGGGSLLGTTKVCVGVLAHNEAVGIATMVGRLVEQSLLRDESRIVEVVVVANGCSDDTFVRAVEACERVGGEGSRVKACVRVVEIKERVGKVGAWNAFVHKLSTDADVLVLVDADVSFSSVDHLTEGVELLEANPEAWVAAPWTERVVDPVTWVTRIAGASGGFPFDKDAFGGQNYTIRANVARQIVLPPGVLVDDGFLKAMVTTDMFTWNRADRVVRMHNKIRFIAESTIRGLFAHEVGLTMGMAINAYIFEYFHAHQTEQFDALAWLRSNYERDPLWLKGFIASEVKKRGIETVPVSIRKRRQSKWKTLSNRDRFKRAPLIFGSWAFDRVVVARATVMLRSDRGFGLWKGGRVDGYPRELF